MRKQQHNGGGTERSFEALCRVAELANYLAKQLSGPARTLAYRIKAEACSSLILTGGATVNGVWPDGIVALDLASDPPARLHVRKSHLTPAAREALMPQAASAPVVERLGDRFGQEFSFSKTGDTNERTSIASR